MEKLECRGQGKVEALEFTEFVVRRDCMPYTMDDLDEARQAGQSPEEYFNYPACIEGVKANSAIHYTYNDRTDPSRMRNRDIYDTMEPILHVRHPCWKWTDDAYVQQFKDEVAAACETDGEECESMRFRQAAMNACKFYEGDEWVPVESLAHTHLTAKPFTDELVKGYSWSNVLEEYVSKDYVASLSDKDVKWIYQRNELTDETAHRLPSSKKGWVWCEDIQEGSLATDDNHGLCTASHWGNTKDELENSFKAWGENKSRTWAKHTQWNFDTDPQRQQRVDFSTHIGTYDKRPMVNALILKNDEAGLDGIRVHCGNESTTVENRNGTKEFKRHVAELKDQCSGSTSIVLKTSGKGNDSMSMEECQTYANTNGFGFGNNNDNPKGCIRTGYEVRWSTGNRDCSAANKCVTKIVEETVCSPNQVNIEGTGITNGGTMTSVFKVMESILPVTKCPDRELTVKECNDHLAKINLMANPQQSLINDNVDHAKPSGCYLDKQNRIHWNGSEQHIVAGRLLCPHFELTPNTTETSQKTFCCDTDHPDPIESTISFDAESNVNQHLHYEFMCINDWSARDLCNPDTGQIVDFQGAPTGGQCADDARTCQYVPIDAYRHGFDILKHVNPEGKQYYGDKKVWSDNVGTNATKKRHQVSCKRRGGVCGLAAKLMEIETTEGTPEGAAWGATKNNQYWFESAKIYNLYTYDNLGWNGNYVKSGNRVQAVHRPEFGNHRQDQQALTNVMVMCCDGHEELAVKGDNLPNESVLADVTYDLNYEQLAHLAGGVAVQGQLENACDNLGGTYNGYDNCNVSSGNAACCSGVRNDNPTGSWEQVNTVTLPDKNFFVKGGNCCSSGDEWRSRLKDSLVPQEMQESELFQLVDKVFRSVTEVAYHAHSVANCAIGSDGDYPNVPGKCCRPHRQNGKGYISTPSPVPYIEWDPLKVSDCGKNAIDKIKRYLEHSIAQGPHPVVFR